MSFFGLTKKNTTAAAPTPQTSNQPANLSPSRLTGTNNSHGSDNGNVSPNHQIAAAACGASPPGSYTPARGQDYKPHYYPAMPHGCESPSSLPSLLPIRQLECPPPSRSLAEQKSDVTGGTIEGKLCRNITLTRVEIKSSYLVNCTLINCISKGCYFTSTRMIATDIVNAPCVISCSLEDSFISLSILSNCRMTQGAVKDSRVMDCDFEAAGVFFCRLTRSSFFHCEYKEIEQVDCELRECDGNGDVDAFFPIVVPQPTPPTSQKVSTVSAQQQATTTSSTVGGRTPSTNALNTPPCQNTPQMSPQPTLPPAGSRSPSKADLTRVQSQPAIMRTTSIMSTPVTTVNNISSNNSPSTQQNMSPQVTTINSNNQQFNQPPSFLSPQQRLGSANRLPAINNNSSAMAATAITASVNGTNAMASSQRQASSNNISASPLANTNSSNYASPLGNINTSSPNVLRGVASPTDLPPMNATGANHQQQQVMSRLSNDSGFLMNVTTGTPTHPPQSAQQQQKTEANVTPGTNNADVFNKYYRQQQQQQGATAGTSTAPFGEDGGKVSGKDRRGNGMFCCQ